MLLILWVVFVGCDKPMFCRFQILSKSPALFHFYSSDVKMVTFPLLTRTYSQTDFRVSAREIEALLANHQPRLTIIPFEELVKMVNDSNAVEPLLTFINGYYEKGAISSREAGHMARFLKDYNPEYFLLLKLERADRYRDLHGEYKIQLTVSGKLYHLQSRSVALSFICTAYSRNPDKKVLPNLDQMVSYTLESMTQSLPYDAEKALRGEKGADWQEK